MYWYLYHAIQIRIFSVVTTRTRTRFFVIFPARFGACPPFDPVLRTAIARTHELGHLYRRDSRGHLLSQ